MDRVNFEKEIEKIVEVSKIYKAKKVLLFGSCVSNIENARDIDIAVRGIKPKDFFKFYSEITMTVEDTVDLLDMDDMDDYFLKRISEEGRILYEKSA